MQSIAQLDRQAFFKLFNHTLSSRRKRVIRAISKLGDGPLYVIAGGILYLIGTTNSHLALMSLVLAFACERPVYFFLKNILKRERPSQCIVTGFVEPSDKFSLPSGHSSAAWLFYVILTWYFPILMPLLAIALAISLSRVMLGVHYPCDIIAGALLGCTFAYFGIAGVAL